VDELITALRGAFARREAGRLPEALAAYGAILRAQPDEPRALLGLADTLHLAGELGRAAETYRRLLLLEPALAGAWWGLGCTRTAQRDHAAAAEAYRRLLALEPAHGMALANLGRSLFELGDVDGAVHAFRAAQPLLPPEAASLPLVNLATIVPGATSATDAEVLEARRDLARTLGAAAPAPPVRGSAGPVRLGYVSAFFSARNWMKPVWALLRHHDRARFQLHLFADRPAGGGALDFAPHPGDVVHDITGLANDAVARQVRDLEIDVLVDLNGYSRPTRLPLFLLRPAPVQVAWFNMFATSGLEGAFDALVGDEHVAPTDQEGGYSEPILRVAGSYLTFDVAYPVPDVAPAPGRAGEALTFGCLAPQYKVTPEVIASWSRILVASPGSRLFLKNRLLGTGSTRAYLRAQFARHGIGPERLVLEGPDEHFRFLAAYDRIDVALDTFPYNGGTTTMEALWQGVPVLTFRGDRWAARISASLLREAGLGEWVACDRADYEARAIALATDPATPAHLEELRRGMRERLAHASVCDVEGFARRMEELYLTLLP